MAFMAVLTFLYNMKKLEQLFMIKLLSGASIFLTASGAGMVSYFLILTVSKIKRA